MITTIPKSIFPIDTVQTGHMGDNFWFGSYLLVFAALGYFIYRLDIRQNKEKT
jgi:hypothetical protein